MYVSHRTQSGFVHIPKTGGTAIKSFVLTKIGRFKRIGEKHSPYMELPNNYFVFALVRNPYHRMASMYRFFYHLHKPKKGPIPASHPLLSELMEESRTAEEPPIYPWRQTPYLHKHVRVFKYEDFDQAVNYIFDHFKLQHRTIKKRDKSLWYGDYDWREFMDKRAFEIINDECADDFKLFNYEKLTWDQLYG